MIFFLDFCGETRCGRAFDSTGKLLTTITHKDADNGTGDTFMGHVVFHSGCLIN